jgi:hypothetical protein
MTKNRWNEKYAVKLSFPTRFPNAFHEPSNYDR